MLQGKQKILSGVFKDEATGSAMGVI